MAELKQPFDWRTRSWLQGGIVRIPVRVNDNGRVELRHGRPLPKMRDGTIGILEVPHYAITDNELFDRLQEKRVEPFLEPESVVMFAIDGDHTPKDIRNHLILGESFGINVPHLVNVELKESPLNLLLRGTSRARLGSVTCWIPALDIEAKSLNHAYRLISERFEPERISHTGNVFELGYYEDEEKGWMPLEYRRAYLEDKYDIFPNTSPGC